MMVMEELGSVERKIADEFLFAEKTGILSMSDEDGFPYSIPMNYHYMKGSVYMHSGLGGKKISLLNRTPRTQFTVFREFAYIPSYVSGSGACSAGYFYISILFSGDIAFVSPAEEKAEILSEMMKKFQPEGKYDMMTDMSVYRRRLDVTSVFFLKPERISVKINFGQNLPSERFERVKVFLAERGLSGDQRVIEIMDSLKKNN